MTEEKKKNIVGIGKYLGIAATLIAIVAGGVTTLDYAGKWFNQASVAIVEIGQLKGAISRHETEQREDFKDIKRELGELRQDVTRALLRSTGESPGGRNQVVRNQ